MNERDPRYSSSDAVVDLRLRQCEEFKTEAKEVFTKILTQLQEVSNTQIRIESHLREGTGRMDRIDEHLEATDADVTALQTESIETLKAAVRRDPLTFWTSVSGALVALSAMVAGILGAFKGGPPPGTGP